MDRIRIHGNIPLRGKVEVSGSKNAALPIIVSSLLTDQPCEYERVPHLHDIVSMVQVLKHLGVQVQHAPEMHQLRVAATGAISTEAPYDLVRKMRASVLVLGPLVARFGKARVSLPGGCAIGARPVNFHIEGLRKLGAEIKIEEGYILASARKLQGTRVAFDFPSVGATENLMMAAALARGETVLENCAREPEIVDLAHALRSMGLEIEGAGTETILIQGRDSLLGCRHSVMGDRIEAGTYLAAAIATRGHVEVLGIDPTYLEAVLAKFEETGVQVIRKPHSIEVIAQKRPIAKDVTTAPFPGFPTDMQAQYMAVMATAQGACVISETIFENRFMHVSELNRLGADITVKGNTVFVRGKETLKGAPLMATDLRASASLIVAGLGATGETMVHRIYHLDRGYEQLEKKLSSLGAKVERLH